MQKVMSDFGNMRMSRTTKSTTMKPESTTSKKRRRTKKSDIYIVVAIIAIVAYTVADMGIQAKTGYTVSDVLTTCWYGFWTSELFALMHIKTTNINKGTDGSDSSPTMGGGE